MRAQGSSGSSSKIRTKEHFKDQRKRGGCICAYRQERKRHVDSKKTYEKRRCVVLRAVGRDQKVDREQDQGVRRNSKRISLSETAGNIVHLKRNTREKAAKQGEQGDEDAMMNTVVQQQAR